MNGLIAPYTNAARLTSLLQAGVYGLTLHPFGEGLEAAALLFRL